MTASFRKNLLIWTVVHSPLLAFVGYMFGLHFAPLLMYGLSGVPLTLIAGYLVAGRKPLARSGSVGGL